MKRQQVVRLAILWGIFLVFLLVVSPTKLPIFVLIVPYVVLFLALRLSWQVAEGFLRDQTDRGSEFRVQRSNLFAAILVAFLALASIGQLTIRDVSTVTLLAFIGYFYMTRNSSKSE